MASDQREMQPTNPKTLTILMGAMQEFLKHGYEGSSMDRVAAQAGVAKATVYGHFRDKEALFTALVAYMAEQKYQHLFTAPLILPGGLTVTAQLKQVFLRILDAITSDDQFLAFIRLVVGESERFPHLAQAFVIALDTPLIATLGQYLASFALPDAEATAHIVSGTILSTVIVRYILHGNDLISLENERLMGTLADLIVATRRP